MHVEEVGNFDGSMGPKKEITKSQNMGPSGTINLPVAPEFMRIQTAVDFEGVCLCCGMLFRLCRQSVSCIGHR